MFWIFIPAIYFYIGPCFGLLNNLSPCHMRSHVHRGFAAGGERPESDRRALGGRHAERLVRRYACVGRRIAAPGAAWCSPRRGFWAACTCTSPREPSSPISSARSGTRTAVGTVSAMVKPTIDRRWLPLNALRAFEGVAKHPSFTAAANALLISQSALSRHVIALEKLIGAQLFERNPHSLVLTKAGQHLLPAVIKSFDRLEYALDDIRNEGAPRAAHAARADAAELRGPPGGAHSARLPARRAGGGDRPGEPLWRRTAARRRRRGGGLLEAHRHGLGERSLVAGALEPALPSGHRGEAHGPAASRDFIEANEIVHVRLADLPRHHLWAQFARQADFPW